MPSPYDGRKPLLERLEKDRASKVVLFACGDRPKLETRIARDAVDPLLEHLDTIGVVKKITLVLYTLGGDALAAWNLVNLLRLFCDDLEILVPRKAHSAGTLMCLGADRIIMTKQATLGPIDPSIDTPLNPIVPGTQNIRAPVSVEAVAGYFSIAKDELGIKDDRAMADVLTNLAEKVHPLVLGAINRSRKQIQFLAGKLLKNQVKNEASRKKIIDFLCSESGSHDYTIDRREAKQMGLQVEHPSQALYDEAIKPLHQSVGTELELNTPFDPNTLVGAAPNKNYSLVRCVLESVNGGSHIFLSEGMLHRRQVQTSPGVTQVAFEDQRQFEGWKKRP